MAGWSDDVDCEPGFEYRICRGRAIVCRRGHDETNTLERFRGIRPALGYPACPDHTEKGELFDLLGARSLGIGLTESYAMTPAAAVSGIYLAHPDARCFAVGRIGRD
jgi:hypothetical protein